MGRGSLGGRLRGRLEMDVRVPGVRAEENLRTGLCADRPHARLSEGGAEETARLLVPNDVLDELAAA